MASSPEVKIVISGQNDAAAALSSAQGQVRSLGDELKKLAGLVAVEELTRRFFDFGIGSAAALQTTSTNMKLLIGNTDQANKAMGDLYNYSRGTPFAFPDVANAAKTLLQYGITVKDLVPTVQMLGNVVAVTGADYQHLASIYGEVNAAGKVQMFNVQELVRDGVPIMQAMANVTGKSMTDIQDAMLKGSLSAEVFDAAMQHIAPPDALKEMANTLPTRLSALQGALRSVAFAILGINIDPIKGFVVQAGGLFDQLSSAVATLAKRLRDPDVQTAMVQLGQTVSFIAGTILPMLFNALTLVSGNLKEIIPVLISFGMAMLIVNIPQFVVNVIGMGAALVGAALAAGPLVWALYALAGVIAWFVGSSLMDMLKGFGNVQTGMGNTVKAVQAGSADIGNAADSGMGKAGKAASDLASKLKDISDNVLKANQDFNESLANIVKTHQDKIASLTDQINTEKSDFAKSQQQKTDDFKQSQADQLSAHEDTVKQIKDQIDDEMAKGRFANFKTLDDLQDRLKKENDSYDKSTASKLATYNKDTQNAKEASDDKLKKLQDQLNGETTFMQKHADDIKGIRASDALDEIEKLKQSHDRQIISLQKQKDDLVNNAQAASIGVAQQWKNAAAGLGNDGTFTNAGNQMGAAMASAFSNSFGQGWNSFVGKLESKLAPFGEILLKAGDFSKGLLNPIGSLPRFATGGTVPGPVGSPVLAVVHGGEVVTLLASGLVATQQPFVWRAAWWR
ncbi:conserved hypothetical protein [Arthrobacter sp. Hiyo6]|nr:conserved hypothetical protein [Arthrobacter sp. Hiyo6]